MADKCKPRIDCFAYGSSGKGVAECKVLTDLYCAKEGKCRFYKTQEQHEADQKRVEPRLIKLGYIHKKGGKKNVQELD